MPIIHLLCISEITMIKTNKDSKKESYDFKSSPFYKCHSVKYLCKVLQIQQHELKYILKQKEEQFVKFERKEPLDDKEYEEIECFKNSVLIKSIRKHKTKDKIRTMIYPRRNTNYKKSNKQIFDVLNRIIKPKYNFMRRKKNENKNFSHLDYVKAHLSNKYYTLTMDISNFYPSITEEKIYNFFKNDMKCCKKVSVFHRYYLGLFAESNLTNCIIIAFKIMLFSQIGLMTWRFLVKRKKNYLN